MSKAQERIVTIFGGSKCREGDPEYGQALQVGALLANNPDYQISIEAFTDNSGNESTLQQLTQDRARVFSSAQTWLP